MKKLNLSFLFPLIFLFSCAEREFSKESGQIESFAEMVKAGVKPIAISPPLSKAEMDLFMPEVERISGKYGISFLRESELIETDLFPAQVVNDLEVILFFKEPSGKAYQDLKSEIESLKADGSYTGTKRRELSRRFGRLLGYPVAYINELLAENTGFRDLEDFGIQGSYLHWYYRDLEQAKAFYTQKLGLKVEEEKENQVVLQLVGDSFLVLNALEGPGYSGQEAKSVALALLTDDLQTWYDFLQKEKVEIKYTLKIKPGGPHDGFVAVDPEGYLLEFETFFQHPENEVLMPQLQELSPMTTTLGTGFSFRGTVTWLYYQDMLPAENFVLENLGLTKSADQGWAKVYRMTNNSYLGLVDGLRGMNTFSPEKLVEVHIDLKNPGPWENYLKANAPDSTRKANSFKDAGGYIFRF
ncbi:hypothetical protein Aoki45_30560 [Algoriphagus sp. oki45]|uniref:VOC family protein n=1 Tax=Algoriphagus sp. oki45 TaxID=3067294 RepID=UPI0027E64D8A|nr:hypothetical protein Aoki45_30560 [Algoriphagus sp. oki45]